VKDPEIELVKTELESQGDSFKNRLREKRLQKESQIVAQKEIDMDEDSSNHSNPQMEIVDTTESENINIDTSDKIKNCKFLFNPSQRVFSNRNST
jgi:hypothetical protein